MANHQAVPDDFITVHDPELTQTDPQYDVNRVRPDTSDPIKIYKPRSSQEVAIVIDLNEPGVANSVASVSRIRIANSNLGTVTIYGKTLDTDTVWTLLETTSINTGDIVFSDGVDLGMVKVVPITSSNEYYKFTIDVAICGYKTSE